MDLYCMLHVNITCAIKYSISQPNGSPLQLLQSPHKLTNNVQTIKNKNNDILSKFLTFNFHS